MVRTLRAVLTCALFAASLATPVIVRAGIVDDIVALTPSRTHNYDRFIAAVNELIKSPRITVEVIGKTHEGREIVLIACHASQYKDCRPDQMPPRLFIVARQHGTEAAGTEAALAMLKYFSTTTDETSLQILSQFTLVCTPMLNADGVAHSKRRNAANIDLNRDWNPPSQPETKAVAAALTKWQPLAAIDMHELPATSSDPVLRDYFVQTIGRDAGVPSRVGNDCRICSLQLADWFRMAGYSPNFYYDRSNEAPNLSHRYFGLSRGIPGYLFESKTGASHSLRERVTYHVLGALVIGNYLIHNYYQDTPPADVRVATRPAADSQPQAAPPAPPAPVPPSLRIVQPAEGDIVADLITISAEAAGDRAAYVTFSVDGVLRAVTSSAPYAYSLNTEGLADGVHSVGVELCDASGHPLLTRQCKFTVSNAAMGE